MRNKVVLVLSSLLISVGYAQIGVNTTLPLHPLHIDVKGNNPVDRLPTIEETKDDIIVTKEGNLGIGVANPTVKLEVNGLVRIKDGTEGLNKILMSDGSGLATWKDVPYDIPTVLGEFTSTNKIIWTGATDGQSYINTNYKISLPKGRWVVNAGLLIDLKNSSEWLLAIISSNSTKNEMIGFKFITVAQENTAYAANLRIGKGMLMGSSIIEVLNDSITLYILLVKKGNWEFAPNGVQNYLYATPVL